MGKAFDKELSTLRATLDRMSEAALSMVADAVGALVAREPKRLRGILEREADVNRLEMEIDDLAWKMMALRQPMGSDLRLIITAIKVNGILERIADEAVNILRKVEYLITVPALKPLIDIPAMADLVTAALRASMRQIADFDEGEARETCLNDKRVNELRDQVARELETYMTDAGANVKRGVALLLVAKSLERVGDLSTDICEDAIYLHTGKDIRHHAESDEEFRRKSRARRKPKA